MGHFNSSQLHAARMWNQEDNVIWFNLVFYMKWESWPQMNNNEWAYSVCSAAMWPQGGELELPHYFLDFQQQATGSLETGRVCRLNGTGQWHYWTQPFQCIRQNGNYRYSDALCLTTRILNTCLCTWMFFLIFVIILPVHFFLKCLCDCVTVDWRCVFSKYNVVLLECLSADCTENDFQRIHVGSKHCLWINGEIYSSVQISPLIWNDLLSSQTCIGRANISVKRSK